LVHFPENIAIWERSFELTPQAKLTLCIHPKTKQIPILSVQIHNTPRKSPSNSKSVDLSAINTTEQEHIFHKIMQARVDENLRQAQEIKGKQSRSVLCKIRGKTLRMIVDTGASVSVLCVNQVELCSVRFLVHQREGWRFCLKEVGNVEQQTMGVIHSLEVMIGVGETGSDGFVGN
jgi:hypothetical protein